MVISSLVRNIVTPIQLLSEGLRVVAKYVTFPDVMGKICRIRPLALSKIVTKTTKTTQMTFALTGAEVRHV